MSSLSSTGLSSTTLSPEEIAEIREAFDAVSIRVCFAHELSSLQANDFVFVYL